MGLQNKLVEKAIFVKMNEKEYRMDLPGVSLYELSDDILKSFSDNEDLFSMLTTDIITDNIIARLVSDAFISKHKDVVLSVEFVNIKFILDDKIVMITLANMQDSLKGAVYSLHYL